MKIYLLHVDNLAKWLVQKARHELHYSTECFFYDAFDYYHESRKIRSEDIHKKFILYLNSGEEIIPPEVEDFALDVLARRVNPYQNQ